MTPGALQPQSPYGAEANIHLALHVCWLNT